MVTQVVIIHCRVYQRDCLVIDTIHDTRFEEEDFKVVSLFYSCSVTKIV